MVSVPVLSVQITVAAPMVSQACILRTRLLEAVILRMLYARLKVTLIASPSGTATTISVTAIMKKPRIFPNAAVDITGSGQTPPSAIPPSPATAITAAAIRHAATRHSGPRNRGRISSSPSVISGSHTRSSATSSASASVAVTPHCGSVCTMSPRTISRPTNTPKVVAAITKPTRPMIRLSFSSCF